MKATGIVRRIDDLGRVVVPKEIRRTLRIREGDISKMYIDIQRDNILKKYPPIGELSQFAGQYAESLSQTTGNLVCITDRDHVVAVAGSGKKEYDGKPLSEQMEGIIENREDFVANKEDEGFVKITLDDTGELCSQAVATIICQGDAIGAVVISDKNEQHLMGDTEHKLAVTAAGFLGRQMEQ